MSSTSSRAVEGAEGIVSPDSYLIEHVKFHSNAGNIVDIKAFIQKIELIEDLNHPFIEGVIFIQDAANFYEEQKISGNEKIEIRIKRTPIGGTKETISKLDLNLYIAEVFNFIRSGPSKQFYKFRIVSEHLYNNQAKVLQRSFQGSIGKLVKDICTRDLQIKKGEFNLDTKQIIKGVYPTIRPIQAVNWLLKNAFDNGTPYFFYDTLQDGIQFNSLENLYAQEAYEEYDFIPYFDHDIGTSGAYDELRQRIEVFGSDLSMGKLNDVGAGAYAATLHSLDISNKKYQKTFFNYDNADPKKLNANKPFSDEHKILDRNLSELKGAKNYFISLNSKAFDNHANYHSPTHTTILKSESHLNTMGFNTHQISLNGDFGLQVGSKVNIKTVKPTTVEAAELPPVMIDKYNSSDYLVTRVVHTFDDYYKMKVTIQRDSSEVSVDA
jgi:hypothetical protein